MAALLMIQSVFPRVAPPWSVGPAVDVVGPGDGAAEWEQPATATIRTTKVIRPRDGGRRRSVAVLAPLLSWSIGYQCSTPGSAGGFTRTDPAGGGPQGCTLTGVGATAVPHRPARLAAGHVAMTLGDAHTTREMSPCMS